MKKGEKQDTEYRIQEAESLESGNQVTLFIYDFRFVIYYFLCALVAKKSASSAKSAVYKKNSLDF